jgi:hypothetical protein
MEEFEVIEGQECRAFHILSWCLSNANIESELGGVVGLSGSRKRIRRPSCRAGTPSAKSHLKRGWKRHGERLDDVYVDS